MPTDCQRDGNDYDYLLLSPWRTRSSDNLHLQKANVNQCQGNVLDAHFGFFGILIISMYFVCTSRFSSKVYSDCIESNSFGMLVKTQLKDLDYVNYQELKMFFA